MTGNESDPFAQQDDPDGTIFDVDNPFGEGGKDTGSASDEQDADNIWGPLPGDVASDHSTQVLESDAFGRPLSNGPGREPFSAGSDTGDEQGHWSAPDFGPSTGSQDAWPAGPAAHLEHEVPPPWEFEAGGGPGAEPPTFHAGAGEQHWQPGGPEAAQAWQQPGNGQQPDGFDPFTPAPAAPDQNAWPGQAEAPPAAFDPNAPGFDPFAAQQQAGGWAPDGTPAGAPSPYDQPGGDGGPFSADPFAGAGGPDAPGQHEQADLPDPFATAAPEPGPFGGPDLSGSPFDAPPFEPQQEDTGGEQQGEVAQFWPQSEHEGGAAAGESAQFWQPQPDEDSHPTDALPRPAAGERSAWPQAGEQQQPAPWSAWPGEAPPPEPPTQHAQPEEPQAPPMPQRYDLSQFQHGYQPPQPPPGQEYGYPQPPPGYGGPAMPPAPGPGQPGPMPGPPGLPGPGQPPAIAAQWQQLPPQQPIPLTSDNLAPQEILRQRKAAPTSGWRRAVFKASGGLLDPGESNKEIQKQQMETLIRTPVAGGHYRVAVLSLKGGVGKTTTTVGLGSTLATLRGDRIIAVDANPDRGTLSEKVRLETRANIRDLLSNQTGVQRYSDVRQYTSQAASRLEVLASDPDPAISEAFSEDDYRSVADVLEHYYSICLTDCGTGLLHSAMRGVLGMADQIVLVSSASVDGARSASATLDWLDAHDYGDLVRTGVVVMSAVRPQNKAVDLSRLEQHFSARCRALVRIPFDPHLEAGAEFVLEQLSTPTMDAYLELTAAVAAGFQHRLPR